MHINKSMCVYMNMYMFMFGRLAYSSVRSSLLRPA